MTRAPLLSLLLLAGLALSGCAGTPAPKTFLATPSSPEALAGIRAHLAETARASGDAGTAVDLYREIVARQPHNLMARQLFLTLGLELQGSGSLPAARAVVQAQAAERAGCAADDLVLDNGSGLSRSSAATADCLARLLVSAWHSAVMPELLASLPVAGVDGTARQAQQAVASAHLKTGSLRDVAAVAGIVLADSGRRYAVVGLINDEHAQSARPALDALVGWAQHDRRR